MGSIGTGLGAATQPCAGIVIFVFSESIIACLPRIPAGRQLPARANICSKLLSIGWSMFSRLLHFVDGRYRQNLASFARHHLDQSLRISDLATRAGLSVFQFDQRIRFLFGVSPGQYVTRLRIDHARERLRHSSASISEIALECGYSDQTAFSRQFRKIVQLTPQKYRMHRSEGPQR